MNTMLKGIFTAAAFTAVVGCADAAPTAPAAFTSEAAAQVAPRPQLTFTNEQSYSEQQEFSATGGQGRISFTGSMTTGTPCYDVTGAVQGRSGSVTLTVSADPTGAACIQVLTFNNYAGEVTRLAPGDYTFTIVHDAGGRQTVYTQQVTVS